MQGRREDRLLIAETRIEAEGAWGLNVTHLQKFQKELQADPMRETLQLERDFL